MKKIKVNVICAATCLFASLTASNSALAQKTHELTFSTYLPPAYEYVSKPIEQFINEVETESNGRIKINYFHSGQLYDGFGELSAVSRGDVDIVNMTGVYPSGSVPALNIFTLPFLYDDTAHLRRSIDAGILDLGIRQELSEKHNTVILGVGPWDPYEFYSKKKPIIKADDIKGQLWATSGSGDARAFQLLGGAPGSLSSSELYLAFDRGVIDATVRPLLTGIGRNLYEVVDYVSLSTFSIDISLLAINKEKWESLPSDLQAIIVRAAKNRDNDQYARVDSFIDEAISTYKSHGLKVNKIAPAEVSKMKELTAPAVDEWSSKVNRSEEYFDIIEKTKSH
ncbi:TRAP transporter substrate-binding protein [Marinobacter salexigens]|uniref:TRAP transporter substrate-binding protein DctP n=1 Tax=Marinobacter salexigens TaxID=1925763 RepID=A0ABS6A4W5_9GAMM|nr:TRAP transporter substrate-binding protein DctP [Marinobacter salexigens]MBU2872555.1 TRAP transporter substrate-binding protein DctP [Marinobacter salexigens]